jgi:hypothetical protein
MASMHDCIEQVLCSASVAYKLFNLMRSMHAHFISQVQSEEDGLYISMLLRHVPEFEFLRKDHGIVLKLCRKRMSVPGNQGKVSKANRIKFGGLFFQSVFPR